ncbi:MAG: D-alanyl-D-alanine carboxypeptidase [Candidatus Eremiobacteraeota bacterium]|nr:D-alanyl-D-alanine carboxypeptidase [Candidatus Eremiobacteraeota bacterium]
MALAALLFTAALVWLVAHAHSAPGAPPAHERASASQPAERAVAAPAAWTAAQRNRLWSELHGAFVPILSGATGWSLAVLSADGTSVFDERAERAVAPASVLKLVVAASALDALGPAYRFHTMFAARGSIGDDGRLDGDLWLIGSGDPSLESSDLRNGVAVLSRSGLRSVEGRVMIDATALAGPALNAHWERDDNGQDYAAPVSAVSLDGDTIESQEIVGGVERKVWTPMQNVAAYVGAQTEAMLAARGIASARAPGAGASPLDTVVLWDHRSPPLQALEAHMLFVSDNHYAEQLLRTVGGEAGGAADDAGGIDAERRFLDRLGVPAPGLRLFDGSGLSPDNRVAAITVARLLSDNEPSLYRLLPLGGREGTLEDYDFRTALGRVRAKSGHLSGVSALAGYANTLHHGRVAFAFLVDGSPGDPDAAIVRAVDRLVEF